MKKLQTKLEFLLDKYSINKKVTLSVYKLGDTDASADNTLWVFAKG